MSGHKKPLAFSNIPLFGERSAKPRDTGLSEIVDWGMPLGQQADYLELTGDFVDVAKICCGFGAIYPLEVLKRKVEIYHAADVKVHPGGLHFEYAVAHNREAEYYDHCHEIGFDMIEISDSRSDWSLSTKMALIQRAIDAGLGVVAEAGGGEGHPIQEMVDDVKASLEIGAWKVTIDTAEIKSPAGDIREELFDALLAEMEMKDMIFELWAVPIWGGSTSQIRETELWLVRQFGPEVNIANLMYDWVFPLEALRRGVGINILSKSGGADYT